MGPGSLPKGIKDKQASLLGLSLEIGFKDGGCPQGTVPIRKITKEDLIWAKSSRNFEKVYPSNAQTPGKPNYRYALQYTNKGTYYGSRAHLNLWEPKTIRNQYSGSRIVVRDLFPDENSNIIQAGWWVNNGIYHDDHAHLTASWTIDGYGSTGCIDVLCPGFVQVSKVTPLGAIFKTPSVYNGSQYYFPITMYLDPVSKDWWLLYGEDNRKVGYWPKALFNSTLARHSSIVEWGGSVYNDGVEPWPEMGSGQYPHDDQQFQKACYIGRIQLIDVNGKAQDVQSGSLFTLNDAQYCYNVQPNAKVPQSYYAFFFGGPGGSGGICSKKI
ncbi:protein neprosin-like [Tasmannia lanceolata]|uniref:protein neprosin-like n=1 Tax=Tasmannia lanceolata TaxID=3420 RepID=UPI004064BBF2